MRKAAMLTLTGLVLGASLFTAKPASAMGRHIPKDYAPKYYNVPIQTIEQQVSTNRASYVKELNDVEFIEYNKALAKTSNGTNYMPIEYHSNVKKKNIKIKLKENQCVYDGIVIQGPKQFQKDIIKTLGIMKEKCREEFDTIRNGIIDEQGKYHSGVGLIRASHGYHASQARKDKDEIFLAGHVWMQRQAVNFYNSMAALLGNEGYRLVYWDIWKMPWMEEEKEGAIVQHRIHKKLGSSPRMTKHLEKVLDEKDKDKFHEYFKKH